MQEALYHARILDHAKAPRNKREMKDASHVQPASNPTCGDTLTLYLAVHEGRVVDASFTGEGCAISQAAASMLTEKLRSMTLAAARRLRARDVYAMLGVEVNPAREKCALLAHRALQSALQG